MRLAIVIILAALLTACGGGGGGRALPSPIDGNGGSVPDNVHNWHPTIGDEVSNEYGRIAVDGPVQLQEGDTIRPVINVLYEAYKAGSIKFSAVVMDESRDDFIGLVYTIYANEQRYHWEELPAEQLSAPLTITSWTIEPVS